MDFEQTWLPFLYLYGIGGIAFLFGMLIIIKNRALRLNYPVHSKWVWILIYGFLFYASIHTLFIFIAIGSK